MKITMKQAYDLFLSDREIFCAARTLDYYSENLLQFFKFVEETTESSCDSLFIDDLPKKILSQYILYLRKKTKQDSNDLLSNNSVRTYCRSIKVFFNFCFENGFCDDYVKGVKLPRIDNKEILPLFQSEVDSIDSTLNLSTEQGLRNYCILHLMLDAGFRSGEVIGLKIGNILFEKNVLIVKLSKNNKSRMITLCPKLKSKLFRYVTFFRDISELDEPVFIQLKTKDQINYNVVKQLFFRLKKKVGIERLHAHLCRHTFATSYILGGGNMEFLRLLLGHCDYSVTKNYLHLANQCTILHADIYKLDSIFFKTTY